MLYGLHARIAGWGRLTNNSQTRFLHTATVRVLTKRECQMRIHEHENTIVDLTPRFICTIGGPYALLHHVRNIIS